MPTPVSDRLKAPFNFHNALGWTTFCHAYPPATLRMLLSLSTVYTPYTMDASPPVAPTFVFPTAPAAASSSAGPTTRSTPAGATPAAAPLLSVSPVSTVRALTSDDKDHNFVISPEQLA
eukprot:5531543-Pleurochrysis_carterae.AAC.1